MKSPLRHLNSRISILAFGLSAVASVAACSAPNDGPGQSLGGSGDGSPAATSTSNPASGTGTDGSPAAAPPVAPTIAVDPNDVIVAPTAGSGTTPVSEGKECAAGSQGTELKGVTLVFGLDVSLSMAQTDVERTAKWEPTVAAVRAFFSDATNTDVSAALTFFPSQSSNNQGGFGGAGAECDGRSYETPDVPVSLLPSTALVSAMDAIDADRLGTPTYALLEGAVQQAIDLRDADPNSNYAIVLVTDGLPALCDATKDDINNVATVAADGFANGFPVYVIGVDTPPDSQFGADGGLANLDLLAAAGGTGTATIIQTGDPAASIAQFAVAINAIKENTFSCTLPIPSPPDGQSFDKANVAVSYVNGKGENTFEYSPDCAADFGWHYDDEAAPSSIVLCDSVCNAVKDDPDVTGKLDVLFACEPQIQISK